MRYGLIGEKLGHSYSKVIHESLGKYQYQLYSLNQKQLEKFITERDFDGLNITIPYKKAVVPFCDQVSDLAQEIGSVNTLYFHQGRLHGTNTDYQGFLYAAAAAGISFKAKKVLILGNGGTCLTARKAAGDQGAAQILIASRRGGDGCITYDQLTAHRDTEIIVNTTPVGMYPNNGEALVNLSEFPSCCGVIDVIYNPFATALLQQANDLGIPCSNGFPMLVAQATAAAEYFLSRKDFQSENQRIIKELQAEIENLIIIGGAAEAALTAARQHGKKFSPLGDVSQAAELGKEKGLLIHVPDGLDCSIGDIKVLTQNGRILGDQSSLTLNRSNTGPLFEIE